MTDFENLKDAFNSFNSFNQLKALDMFSLNSEMSEVLFELYTRPLSKVDGYLI